MPADVRKWHTALKCSTIRREKGEILEKLNVETYEGIQKAYDRKCELGTRHDARLEEVVGKHSVVNDIMVSPILRRMVDIYNKMHYFKKKKGKQENERCKQIPYQNTASHGVRQKSEEK